MQSAERIAERTRCTRRRASGSAATRCKWRGLIATQAPQQSIQRRCNGTGGSSEGSGEPDGCGRPADGGASRKAHTGIRARFPGGAPHCGRAGHS
jgi:hypothetical protein